MAREMVAIIPARYKSSRLPGKLLLNIEGKSILQRVYERALQCPSIDHVFIATDSELIFKHATDFGAECFLSNRIHESGTDRIAELAETITDAKYIINIQGDEPFIDPEHIEILCKSIQSSGSDIATLAVCNKGLDGINNPNSVKVVINLNNQALYFSRAEIPFLRDKNSDFTSFEWLKHIGIYAFRKKALLQVSKLEPTDLEHIEKLEQLRWLQNNYSVQVTIVDKHSIGIDTEQDYLNAIEFAKQNRL